MFRPFSAGQGQPRRIGALGGECETAVGRDEQIALVDQGELIQQAKVEGVVNPPGVQRQGG